MGQKSRIDSIEGFEIMTKNFTVEGIKIIFENMVMENKVSFVQKNQEMFHKQEGCILTVHSLTNQRQDSLSKDLNELKESLIFPKVSMKIDSRIWATKYKN